MTPQTEQMIFPFPSLDFPGRAMIPIWEMAKKLGKSTDHLLNEVEHGALVGVDFKGAKASRRDIGVPIESYRQYILTRMTGEFRRDFIRDLPAGVKRQLRWEMIGASDKTELHELLVMVKEALAS